VSVREVVPRLFSAAPFFAFANNTPDSRP
jgi:hypothetical protein